MTTSSTDIPVDLAVRDRARRDEAVAARLRRVDDRRMALLREMIGTFCVAIGAHFLAADHEGRSRADVLARAADLLLDRKNP